MVNPILQNDNYVYSPPTDKSNEPVDLDMLNYHISEIETSLIDDSWLNKEFSLIDKFLIPSLVRLANQKKDGLNLVYLNAPYELPDHIKATL